MAFFSLFSLRSREIDLNFLFFLFLSQLFLELTFWFWRQPRVCCLIIRLPTFRLSSGRTFFGSFISQILKLEPNCIRKKAESYFLDMFVNQVVFVLHLTRAFFLSDKACGNIGKLSPEWVLSSASARFKRNHNYN